MMSEQAVAVSPHLIPTPTVSGAQGRAEAFALIAASGAWVVLPPGPQGRSATRRWSDVGPGWRAGPGPDALIRRLTGRTSSRPSTSPSQLHSRILRFPTMVRPIHRTGSGQWAAHFRKIPATGYRSANGGTLHRVVRSGIRREHRSPAWTSRRHGAATSTHRRGGPAPATSVLRSTGHQQVSGSLRLRERN
jgi:hypothetical protein